MTRFFRRTALLALLLACAGCMTGRQQFPPPDPSGKTLTGQMLYSGPKRTFVGDFTARVSATDFYLSVSKGPGVPLFSVRKSGGTLARIETPNRSWQGNPQHFIPGPVRSWLALGDVLAGKPVESAQVTRTDGRVTAEFASTHERFVFQLSH